MDMKEVSKTKKPLRGDEPQRCEDAARELGGEHLKAFLLLRFTGCHPRVIYGFDHCAKKGEKFKEYGMHEDRNNEGLAVIVWSRPKKKGKAAWTSVPRMPQIDFNIDVFLKEIRGRKSNYKKSVRFCQDMMNRIGKKAGTEFKLSPLSLRHTLATELLLSGLPAMVVCDTLNIAPSTLREYARMVDSDRDRVVYNSMMGMYSGSTPRKLEAPAHAKPSGPDAIDRPGKAVSMDAIKPRKVAPLPMPIIAPEPEPDNDVETPPENAVAPKDEPDIKTNPLNNAARETEICPVCDAEYDAGNQCPICPDTDRSPNQCPDCNTPHKPGTPCPFCGADDRDISQMPIKCPECGTEYPPDMKGCPVCPGAEVVLVRCRVCDTSFPHGTECPVCPAEDSAESGSWADYINSMEG